MGVDRFLDMVGTAVNVGVMLQLVQLLAGLKNDELV